MVGLATVSLAEVRLRVGAPRASVTLPQALGGVAAVIGRYALTALSHAEPGFPATVFIVALAMLTWCVLGDAPSVVCGVLAAGIGSFAEVLLVVAGATRRCRDSGAAVVA